MTIELPNDVEIKKLPVKQSRSVGRPRKYQTPKELKNAIDDYFTWLEDHNETMQKLKRPEVRPTLADLALSLGFGDRGSLYQYKEVSVGFLHVINAAKLRIEAYHARAVSAVPGYSMQWLKKNAPDEWGSPGEEDGNINVIGDGEVTINIQKNYGKVENE